MESLSRAAGDAANGASRSKNMLLIPAIDLKAGQCVRLRQGRMDTGTVFSDDPVAIADKWARAGCERLHIVDLDGAYRGRPVNAEVIHRICAAHPAIAVQVGGGIRDADTVTAYLKAGARFVIIGTQAVKSPGFVREMCAGFPGRIIVGLDAKDGRVALEGWAQVSRERAVDIARGFADVGVTAIIYTDIARDGMMGGVNVAATRALAESVDIPVIASGGVSRYADIRALVAAAGDMAAAGGGIAGAIIGRALYEGAIDFAQARKITIAVAGAGEPPQ